jgi:8-oxo-dGTP diphosphatase
VTEHGADDLPLIEAAGGVLWRPVQGEQPVEVALVHRPKYDDWSIPKGKLSGGEHVLLGALREVEEETGHVAVPGRPLGEIRYEKDGAPKRVRYWAMRDLAGSFRPGPETDQMVWLPPREGQVHLLPERDRAVLAGFATDIRPTRALVVIRHASAGSRATWSGDDADRPLDAVGHAQAEVLAQLLGAYQVERLWTADVRRCIDTLRPYALERGLSIDVEPLFSESGYEPHPDTALIQMLALARSPVPLAVCSQGGVVEALVQAVCTELGGAVPPGEVVRKGGLVVLHLADDGAPEVVAAELFEPVA